MKARFDSAIEIATGLIALLLMLLVVFPALMIWARFERLRMDKEYGDFDLEGRPVLREVERARAAHEEGWRP